MTDQPQTPSGYWDNPSQASTAAGRELLSHHPQADVRSAILAIEAEAYNSGVLDQKLTRGAEGQIAALREDLELLHRLDPYRKNHKAGEPAYAAVCSPCRVLSDTASAATEYESRRDAEAILEWLGSPHSVELLVGAVADNPPDPDNPMITNEWAVEIFEAIHAALSDGENLG